MKNIKIFSLPLIIAALVCLVIVNRTHRDIPSDLRDAVADNAGGFDTSIPVISNDSADILVSPPSKAAAVTRASKPEIKKWTVMVYMNNKNDLDNSGLADVNEMETVGSGRDMNIVVQAGRIKGGSHFDKWDWTGGRRYLITRDRQNLFEYDYNQNTVQSKPVWKSPGVDMGDYKSAVDFVKWTKGKYPARRYLLIIWNHGSGWWDPAPEPKSSAKGISFDDQTGNYIRTAQIGTLLKEAGGADILAFDACLMQGAEVAYEVKDHVKFIVGSEETEPGAGYDYTFLAKLKADPDMTDAALASVMVNSYRDFYTVKNKATNISALDASKLPGLAAKMRVFAELALEVGDDEALSAGVKGAMRYSYPIYGDLSSFVTITFANIRKEHPRTAEFKAAALDLDKYIKTSLVIANAGIGKDPAGRSMSESKGISVYLPYLDDSATEAGVNSMFEAPYSDFAFDKATAWGKLVSHLYTLR